jgi:Asp-tRNA(Asn)/Glu-tRNA(Gln) amidotransferase B subunit
LPPVSLPNAPETITSTYTTPETGQALTQAQFSEALTALSEATPEQVTEIVDTILNNEITTEQATQLVAAVEVLSAITGEQAQQLFQAIEPAQLSESMAAVIANSMNNPAVPDEVKEAFEDTLNIFGNDGFATYVPLGSNVNVAVRRTIIAGTTILVALPSPAPARRT